MDTSKTGNCQAVREFSVKKIRKYRLRGGLHSAVRLLQFSYLYSNFGAIEIWGFYVIIHWIK
jgi:hypothetical protein